MPLDRVTLVGGQVISAHKRDTCYGYWCPIHYPSPHHMQDWPQNWRSDRGIMERMCPHGQGHPDPDDHRGSMDEYQWVHGCDGCCTRPFDIEGDAL